MLARLKMRFLLVIIIIAITGLIMQSDHYGKNILLPVLQYIMEPDSRLEATIKTFFNFQPETETENEAVGQNALWQMPCEYNKIARNYGWYWNIEKNKQEFNPGIYLQVNKNTAVSSILSGVVDQVTTAAGESTITIQQGDTKVLMAGFNKVLVQKGQEVKRNGVIGLSSEMVYIEVREQGSPVNPDIMLQ